MFKKILPVAIGIVLILLIAVGVSVVKNANNRTPNIKNAKDTYMSYNDLNVTYDRIYTYMKNGYGTAELLDMVDEKIYAKEIAALNEDDEEFVNYVKDLVFSNHDFSNLSDDEKETAQKAWDDVIMSLKLTNILKSADIDDTSFLNESSKVWKTVKSYYKLSYVRNKAAKEAYWNKYLEARDSDLPFDMTNAENSSSSIEAYFKENYTGSSIGFFIPFTSEAEALAMMEANGINVNSNVLSSNNGWVKSSYDYYSKAKVEAEDKLSYEEVIKAFMNMYNDVFRYLNDGNDILSDSSFHKNALEAQTAYKVLTAVKEAFTEDSYAISLTLPTTVSVNGGENATLSWGVTNSTYGSINEQGNVVSGNFSRVDENETEISLNLALIVKYGETSVSSNVNVILKGERDEQKEIKNIPGAVTEVTVGSVDPFEGYVLNEDMYSDDFLEEHDNLFRFKWTKADCEKVNSTLSTYLTPSSTTLTIDDNPDNLYKSYTTEPVKVGNYYFLILKLQDVKQTELFEKDADGNNSKDDKGNYIIADNDLYNEIVEAKKEALLTDNAVNEMIYETRYNAGLKIYDAYIEAIYEYQYKTFYETTIAANDYNKYKTTKKNKKTLVAEFTVGNDKVKIESQELFDRLEAKYAGTACATFIENYILVSDTKYNNIYNPYTNTTLNKEQYKNLMTSEVATLKQNFEADYFTYSYLSYYGFTPNFPSTYGWQKFIKDYFNSLSDQELLTNSSYGGSIYKDALTAYTDDAYTLDDVVNKMNETYNDWFSVSVVNLLITIDPNYNADSSNSNASTILLEEKDNWTDKQKELASELADLMYEVANQTNAANLADQMTALVTLYNDAALEYDEAEWNTARSDKKSIYDFNYFGKYKLQGLHVTFETANTYDTSSSIMSEFADECRVLWQKADELGLVGKSFDVPLRSEHTFFTDYGLHAIACLSASEKVELPTLDEMKLHRANALLKAAKDEVKSAQDNIDSYSKQGYRTTSYEAAKAYAENKVAKYQAEWDELVKSLGLASDYEIPTDVSLKLETWYDNAEKAVEGGTIVTRSYIKTMQETFDKVSFTSNTKLNKDEFSRFIQVLIEACDKSDAEAE